jgi:hypothetical protein
MVIVPFCFCALCTVVDEPLQLQFNSQVIQTNTGSIQSTGRESVSLACPVTAKRAGAQLLEQRFIEEDLRFKMGAFTDRNFSLKCCASGASGRPVDTMGDRVWNNWWLRVWNLSRHAAAVEAAAFRYDLSG